MVYGTALLAAGAFATGGAILAAPAGASVLAPIGTAAPTGLAVPTGVVAAGAGATEAGLAEAGLGLARGVGGELMKDAALPVIEEALPVAEQTLPQLSMRVTPETINAVARQEMMALLRQRLEQAAREEVEKAAAKAAIQAIRAERLDAAVQAAGPFLGALALRFMTPANPGLAASANALQAIGETTGALYLLKLRDGVDPRGLPYCQPFPVGKYSAEQPGAPAHPGEKFYYLGLVECL